MAPVYSEHLAKSNGGATKLALCCASAKSVILHLEFMLAAMGHMAKSKSFYSFASLFSELDALPMAAFKLVGIGMPSFVQFSIMDIPLI